MLIVPEGKKPLKVKGLKIIDQLGTLYATFNGSNLWQLDRVVYGVLNMCDGRKTVDQITEILAKRIFHTPEDVKPVVEKTLSELAEMKFIEWVE